MSYFMLKTLAKELAFSASSLMSLHRRWKYVETAISLHVWTASKIPRWLRLSTGKSSPPNYACGHMLSLVKHPPG